MTTMVRRPLRPCNPFLHPAYAPLFDDQLFDDQPPPLPLPPDLVTEVRALAARRDGAPDHVVDAIDAEIVGRTYWHVLRPDAIARAIVGRRSRVSRDEAVLILVACAEAGYDISGNGGPDFARRYAHEYAPIRGPERDEIIWAAAEHWARLATRDLTFVSLGDRRGYLPRPVQYDQPGSLHPGQRAALTLGPRGDAYMRRHTRRLLVVRDA